MLEQKTVDLVKRLFKEYYSKADDIAPPHMERREFGFGDFEKKVAYRHAAFKSAAELKRHMTTEVPPFASYSTAEYERPDARPMESKGWLGSELIFDLDATDLRLPCQEKHGRSWVCSECLGAVKDETRRLIEDFLVPDFGFSENEISINFSGNRGYHVHVADESAFTLDSPARRQITEYIAGIGIDSQAFFPTLGEARKTLYGPRPTDGGWGGKFAKGMIGALNGGEKSMLKLGVDAPMARKLAKSSADVVLGISVGNWDKVRIPKKADFWERVIRNMAISQGDSIDKNVTNDTHHLIRLPNTLHGDTGLVGKKIRSVSDLDRFDPMKDGIAFRTGFTTVKTDEVPAFTMVGEQLGPYDGQTVELPTYAALYLLLKRVAVL